MLRIAAAILLWALSASAADRDLPIAAQARAMRLDHPAAMDTLTPLGRADFLMRSYRFDEARTLIDSVRKLPRTPEMDWMVFRWLFLTEDLRAVDRRSDSLLKSDSTNVAAALARGELAYRLLKNDEAQSRFERIAASQADSLWTMRAKLGVAKVLYKRDRYQASLDILLTLFKPGLLNEDVLYQTSLTLIQLGRVSEAIELCEEALNWTLAGEYIHYYLGNGYARLNYTQLAEKYPGRVGSPAVAKAMRPALDFFSEGNSNDFVQATAVKHWAPDAVEPDVFIGSILWDAGMYGESANYFREALQLCPEYGRAHAGLAKALEGMRMQINVHRQSDSTKFRKNYLPDIPQIDRFVLNWKTLSPRHKLQVALAMAPWKAYIPVLVECGSYYYIKPIHELLSQSPGLEAMRDARIDYDSRLWDDVRGCGGFTTVTGVEDVERSIYSNYNTVLHELTHQVHGLFPPDDAQKILDTFYAARKREDGGTPTFMSAYQQASVWEYFAEGANAYFSPRRDEYDTRDVVRERLLERDTTLVSLVNYFVYAPNLDECYTMGYINAADHAVEQQKLDDALTFARKAAKRDADKQRVYEELAYLYSLKDDDKQANLYADSLQMGYPGRASAYTQAAQARFMSDGNADTCIRILRNGLEYVRENERKDVRRALGRYLLHLGRYEEAAENYRAVLAEVRDDPNALWGLGYALGELRIFPEADSAYRAAVEKRNGIVELRLAYADMLRSAGRLTDAEAQVAEAELLAANDPQVMTMRAYLFIERDRWEDAKILLEKSAIELPDDRLSSILLLKTYRHLNDAKAKKLSRSLQSWAEKDVPAWVFVPRTSSYTTMRTWTATDRRLLQDILPEE